MADVPTVGAVSFSQMRGSTNNTGQGVSLGNLNLHNLNTPQRLGQIASSQTLGTSKRTPPLFSQPSQQGIVGLYSMKLANPYYTGPVLKAQRSIDNSTLDFWADADGALMSATGNVYSTWVGSGTANLLTWYDQSQNDMEVLKYPPISLGGGTSNPTTATLTSAPYGNGSYIYSASTQYNTSEFVGALFNASGNYQSYTSAGGNDSYNGSTGVFTGSTSTTVSGTPYGGAWVQIQLPYGIYPTSYYRLMSSTRNETSHVLAGSNNGTTWTLLNSATEPAYTTSSFINLNVTASYSYFRLIAREINPANTYGYWSLCQLDLYGRQALTSSRNAVSTTASGGNPPLIVTDPLTSIAPYLVGTATANHSAPTSNVALVLPGPTGNYMQLNSHPANFDMVTNNLFVECWYYASGAGGGGDGRIQQVLALSGSSSQVWGLYFAYSTYNYVGFYMNNTVPSSTTATLTATLNYGAWNHIAASWVASSKSMYVFCNGVASALFTLAGTTIAYDATRFITIGSDRTLNTCNGYMRDVRVVQGGSVPTATFTPNQAPFSMSSPTYVSAMGTPVLALDRQYFSNGKYVAYFPNSAATTSAYYGLTFSPQTISGAMMQYRTISNPSTYQTFWLGRQT